MYNNGKIKYVDILRFNNIVNTEIFLTSFRTPWRLPELEGPDIVDQAHWVFHGLIRHLFGFCNENEDRVPDHQIVSGV